jgi:sugar/nucleoside kinase (ribokinase family)
MEEADVHTGGAVANTGLGMKLLGADVRLMGKIGRDSFGEMVLNILSKYGVTEGMIVSPEVSTSYSVIIAAPGVDRVFLHHPGANDTFGASDIDESMLKDAVLFHFGYPPIMKNIYQNGGEELYHILKRVKDMNIATSMDMAAVDASSEAGKADWKKIIQRVIPYVDFFAPSVEELCFMLDRPRYEEWLVRAEGKDVTGVLSIEKDVKPLADELMEMGAKVVLIKCGAPGIYYRTAGENILKGIGSRLALDPKAWADKDGFEKSYEPEKVLSGTGAGDTSIAAFLTAILKNYPFEKCLQLSTAAGASCVEAYDALSGLKPLEELEKKIHSGWRKQNLIHID